MEQRNVLSKEQLEVKATRNGFVYDDEFVRNWDLDATHARKYLESRGFEVVRNWDAGTNGWAETKCGIRLSTNGYIYRLESPFGHLNQTANKQFEERG